MGIFVFHEVWYTFHTNHSLRVTVKRKKKQNGKKHIYFSYSGVVVLLHVSIKLPHHCCHWRASDSGLKPPTPSAVLRLLLGHLWFAVTKMISLRFSSLNQSLKVMQKVTTSHCPTNYCKSVYFWAPCADKWTSLCHGLMKNVSTYVWHIMEYWISILFELNLNTWLSFSIYCILNFVLIFFFSSSSCSQSNSSLITACAVGTNFKIVFLQHYRQYSAPNYLMADAGKERGMEVRFVRSAFQI